jgi:hypothetical protein
VLTLSFTTFLKFCASTPRGKISAFRTFQTPGGYDFYKVLKKLAAGLAAKQISLAEAKDQIAEIKQLPERKHTLNAIERFHAWLADKHVEFATPPKRTFSSPSGLIKIRLEPELAFKNAEGTISVLYIWNLDRPELSTDLAGQGLRLLMDKVIGEHFEFGLLDLRKSKVIGDEALSAASDARLQANIAIAEQTWKDLNTPNLSIEDTLTHIAALKLPPAPPVA